MENKEPTNRPTPRNEGNGARAELLLRIPDAARSLGIGRTTFYKLIDDGDIRVVRIGRAVRVPLAELHAFIARCHTDALR